MVNLLEETLEILKEIGKKPEDINWIGSEDGEYVCSWKEFIKLANKEYDNGYGAQQVARDLVIVFKDGLWLERAEYDGNEWWEYKKTPQKKNNPKKIRYLFAFEVGKVGWCYLEDLNGGKE